MSLFPEMRGNSNYFLYLLTTKTIVMKLGFKKGFSSLLLIGLISTSCSKYEEGSTFTLLTKKARMVNEWTLETTQTNNLVYPESSELVRKYTFKKDGTYVYSTTTILIGASTLSYSGKWAFSSDKTKLVLTEEGNNYSTEYLIIELKNKEMKLKDIAYDTSPSIYKYKGL